MITREQALEHITNVRQITGAEELPLHQCLGRTLANDVRARLTHPPAAMSAMDGYAVKFTSSLRGETLRLVGEAAAGAPYEGSVGLGECVRVFTGSVIPDGADHVVVQEDVLRTEQCVLIQVEQARPRNIRSAGIDFHEGDVLLPACTRLSASHLSICAAANHPSLTVRRRPTVGLLTNGDELRPPGAPLTPGQIISSNEYALTALIDKWGGNVINLGTASDDPADIRNRVETADGLDVFVPIGGASVGDHDHMKGVFAELEFEQVFSKVAIKPGKPTWLSKRGNQVVLGLPGNPASALVCAHLFLRPLLQSMLGHTADRAWTTGRLIQGIPANGPREAFLRGEAEASADGTTSITPASDQDSSLLRPFIKANILIHRPPNAPALNIGDLVDGVRLD